MDRLSTYRLPDNIDAGRLLRCGTCVQSLQVDEVRMLCGAQGVQGASHFNEGGGLQGSSVAAR